MNRKLFSGEYFIDKDGYRYNQITNNLEDYIKDMAVRNYIAEHRQRMAESLGRRLHRHEEVDHKDRNRLNNDINNLLLINKQEHLKNHINNGHFKLFSKKYQPKNRGRKKKLLIKAASSLLDLVD